MEDPAFPAAPPLPAPNAILARLLERLYASLVGGASLNCRPHRSRQRVDLFSFNALGLGGADLPANGVVSALLGEAGKIETVARGPFRAAARCWTPPGPTAGSGRRGFTP